MTAKELKRMSRSELLQLLIDRSSEVEKLNEMLAQKTEQLSQASANAESRSFSFENAGSLAEAAVAASNIINDAQKAADLYLSNIERMRKEQEAAGEKLLAEAREKAEALINEAQQKCALMEADARRRCDELRRNAEQDSQHNWEELSRRLDQLSDNNAELRSMLSPEGKKRKWHL